ncbi:hypothetical protein EJ04DRAFT_556846 [Polyplosphaeria fusca]|uniref:Uncharacterized protein n=1 Tax=Polyplosphaeria fusca TaxID=682080 RepID=A0A9P4QKS4_9PLEO|nr:hypothetical protein EJ04DRAFT_556846 [Polyplosphaeria fusca]
MDDHIVLNFCPRSALSGIGIHDTPHLFHVVIEPEEMSAEIYTHEKQFCKSLSLGEGRRRKESNSFLNKDETLPDAGSERMPPQDEPTERERAMMEQLKEMKERERAMHEEMKERERAMNEKMKERERAMHEEMKERERVMHEETERLREETRLHVMRGEDREEMTREGGGKKRRR